MIAGFMILSIILVRIYGNNNNTEKKRFLIPIAIMLTGAFLSTIIAKSFHNQAVWLTLWAQSPMYWYILYFFLHDNKYAKNDLEKAILIIAFLYSVFLIIQYVMYPNILFNIRIDDDPNRGTIRIFLLGFSFLIIGYYIALNKFLSTNKIIYLIPILLFFSINIMQGTRQFLFSMILITAYAIFFSKKVKSRGLIIFLISLSSIPVYLMFQDIFRSMIELSTAAAQGEDLSANARERAILFFLTDFFPSDIAYILGNGMDHMRSEYGLRVALYKRFGLYQSDIGIIGEYTIYGVLFVIGALIMIVKMIKFKLSEQLYFVKYFAMNVVLLLPLSGFFTSTSEIAVLCILFYLSDCELNKGIEEKKIQ